MAVLPYSIREGLKGLARARFAAFASTSAMAVSLLLVGTVLVIGFEAAQVAQWLRERVGEAEIFLEVDTDDVTGQSLERRLALHPAVVSTRYVSKAEAVEIFRREFGEGAEAFFDRPFLPPSIRVQFRQAWANPDSLAALKDRLERIPRVDEVQYNQALLVAVQRNLRLITFFGAGIGFVVLLASIFLVANTIRLTIYARRLLIRTMKLVGATDAFIRRPFLVEGAAQGFVAGLLAAGLLWGAVESIVAWVPELHLGDAFLPLAMGTVVGAGVALGWLGSLLSVRRFIRNVAVV